MKRAHYSLSVVLLILIATVSHATTAILQDAEDARQTVDFAIGEHAFYIPQGRFFFGADEPIPGNEFALSAVAPFATNVVALTPELVTLNNTPNQTNPLHGVAIRHMGMIGNRLLVVSKNHPARLHVVDPASSISVYQSSIMRNANGEETAKILGVASSAPREEIMPETIPPTVGAFVALSNSAGRFDGNGSGIGLGLFKLKQELDEESQVIARLYEWALANAETGEEEGNRAASLGPNSEVIGINAPVSQMAINDLFFDAELNRLYLGLTVTTGDEEEAAARAVVVAYAIQNKVHFVPLGPAGLFDGTTIVGAAGVRKTVSIHKVRTMHTTTRLRYLVAVSGAGTDEQAARSVYALPLVDDQASPCHGTLAAVHQVPAQLVTPEGRLQAFIYKDPAQSIDDVWHADSPAAVVGGGSAPGAICKIEVIRDAVYVSVEGGDGDAPGVFCSQALFDVSGRIARWTRWARAGAGPELLAGFVLDPSVGHLWYLPANDQGITRLLKRTTWDDERIDVLTRAEFSADDGGVHGVDDLPRSLSGLSQEYGSRLSAVAVSGLGKVALIQTGKDTERGFCPDRSDLMAEIFRSTDGSLAGLTTPVPMVLVEGGDLEDLGPISHCAVASDGISGWFVVAGAHGLAVLARSDGTGFDAAAGLKKGFEGLTSDVSFKKIGSFEGVRKLIALGNDVYVLTNKEFAKFVLTPDVVKIGQAEKIMLAQSDKGPFNATFFSDVFVAPPIALLATSRGLYRTGNKARIHRVQGQTGLGWTRVALPESCGSFSGDGPVTRLFPVTSADGFLHNIYVLNGAVAAHQAHVYRLVVRSGDVTDVSVELFRDLYRANKRTFYVSIGDYRNFIYTDGALFFASRSAYGGADPLLEIFPPYMLNSMRWGTRGSIRLPMRLDGAKSIRQLVRLSATGGFVAYGDFGTRTLQ